MDHTPPTSISLVGAYRVLVSPRSLADAARFLGYEYLLKADGTFKMEDYAGRSLNDIALLELAVEGPLAVDEIRMGKGASAQVPYLEFYLSPSGNELLFHPTANRNLPQGMRQRLAARASAEPRRTCFFLHRVQPGANVHVGQERFAIGGFDFLPPRLMRFAHYIPVD
jgi:hypothetical protein